MKKYKKILLRALAVSLLLVGIALIFNEQIKTFVIREIATSQLKKKPQSISKKMRKKGNFDFKSVKAADLSTLSKAAQTQGGMIGKIAIPQIGMRLPIFYGINNENLLRGAGTMKPAEKMGTGNYALAGHHMSNPDILFSPLAKAKVGMEILLTDGKKVYRYRIVERRVIDKYQVNWIDDVPKQQLVTLVTCLTATTGETNRIMVQGKLEQVQPATKDNLKEFES
ncbi:class A sortase [Liquorilactobacillus satsumensis]|uniref:class A sortase n=1 Tax=Liquorilactobacillus satsumensis TaxID=259059 RepID=UPI0021C2A234|nr:class A sortase [Liquorilactobacillus satsumensis]MCP9329174.1 class A sortase [Liquorilactobacillus satsumensis]